MIQTPDAIRSWEDSLILTCNKTLAQIQNIKFVYPVPDHFLIQTDCIGILPSGGTIYEVHGHAHTQTKSFNAEIEVNGQWQTLLDLPDYNWLWHDKAYSLVTPIQIAKGQRLKITCVHDNGALAQWSLLTNTPNGPPPLQDTSYTIYGYSRRDEMCNLALGWVSQ